MDKIVLESKMENIKKVIEFVNSKIEKCNFKEKEKLEINIAIDELFGNIVKYAYGEEVGIVEVQVKVKENPLEVEITFIDSGTKYNPLEREEPNIEANLNERKIGGLGIFIARKLMDEIKYEYKDGKNVLSIICRGT